VVVCPKIFSNKEFKLLRSLNAERVNALTEIDVKYQTLEKEEEIKDLQQKGKIVSLEMETQKLKIIHKNRLIISFSLLLVAMVSIAYFWRSKQNFKIPIGNDKNHQRNRGAGTAVNFKVYS